MNSHVVLFRYLTTPGGNKETHQTVCSIGKVLGAVRFRARVMAHNHLVSDMAAVHGCGRYHG
jgi:hypothetical protein